MTESNPPSEGRSETRIGTRISAPPGGVTMKPSRAGSPVGGSMLNTSPVTVDGTGSPSASAVAVTDTEPTIDAAGQVLAANWAWLQSGVAAGLPITPAGKPSHTSRTRSGAGASNSYPGNAVVTVTSGWAPACCVEVDTE